jgi:site-specific DNA recombinase
MRAADLYIRVSTDEQADKGYSQRDQEERLRKYCAINSIDIRKVIFEDHSAKTFNRPQWNSLLAELSKSKGKHINLILFTKWDRFSRNTSDAYQMIGRLSKWGIEPQAVEQPLNLEIPENKIMLAFYLATPEVENDRRALNVKHGMRRARKEGRYMGRAPYGYDNKSREDGSKYIVPNPKEAPMLRWIFQAIAEGVFAPDQIRKMVNDKGLMISKSNFYREIRNPVYCGKIVVKQYKDEDEQWVDGQHEPIISEALFYEVQDVLCGRKKVLRVQAVKVCAALPLKGFVQCDKCDRPLTGSASKGRSGFYYYYHAQGAYGCGCRYKADAMNKEAVKMLKRYVPASGMNELYKLVVSDIYRIYKGSSHVGRREISEEISKLNAKLANARDMLFDEKLDHGDYKIMKRECEEKLKRLEIALTEAKVQSSNQSSIDHMLLKAIEALSKLNELFSDGDILKKREVLGSIFREKLGFDGFNYRTGRISEPARLIFQINKELRHKKNGKDRLPNRLSRSVLRAGIEPALRLREQDFKSCVSTSSTI